MRYRAYVMDLPHGQALPNSRCVLPDNFENVFSSFEGMVGLWNVRPGGEQCPSDARVVALISLPTM